MRTERETAERTLMAAIQDYTDQKKRAIMSQQTLYLAIRDCYDCGIKRSWLEEATGFSKSWIYLITTGMDPATKEPLRIR